MKAHGRKYKVIDFPLNPHVCKGFLIESKEEPTMDTTRGMVIQIHKMILPITYWVYLIPGVVGSLHRGKLVLHTINYKKTMDQTKSNLNLTVFNGYSIIGINQTSMTSGILHKLRAQVVRSFYTNIFIFFRFHLTITNKKKTSHWTTN